MFETGEQQEIADILHHKEQRALCQQRLLERYTNASLVSFTLNIPGPVKNNATMERVFNEGQRSIKNSLKKNKITCLYKKEFNFPSGQDAFYVLLTEPFKLKRLLIEIEENHLLGRLLDIDVIYSTSSGNKIISRQDLGGPVRTCIICEKNAKLCSRSRAHSIEELQSKIETIVENFEKEVNRL